MRGFDRPLLILLSIDVVDDSGLRERVGSVVLLVSPSDVAMSTICEPFSKAGEWLNFFVE